MKVAYLAGPYRARNDQNKWSNIMEARRVARAYWMVGWAVICPHMNSAFMDGDGTEGIFLDGDLEILRRCDTIIMMKDWQDSQGATAELALAKSLNKEIIFD